MLMRSMLGFSLIELGVVLLVISVLIGGVLKGRELLEISKLQRLVQDIHSIQSAIDLYRENYQYWPGDDPNASNRFTGQGVIQNGNGNGKIEASNESGESQWFWQHLRAAQLLSASSNATGLPSHPFGGQIKLQNNRYNIEGLSLLATRLNWKQAYTIDEKEDDGRSGLGRIRIGTAGHILPTPPNKDIQVEVAFALP